MFQILLKYHRWVILFCCIIETIFMGAVHFGWNGLVPVWEEMGIYACPGNFSSDNTTQCSYQSTMLSRAFVAAATAQVFVIFPCGIVYDRIHLRWSKVFGAFIFLMACMFMAFVAPATSGLLFPSGILFAFSTAFILVCNLPIGKLFPKQTNFVVSIISGSMDSSSVVFQLIAFGYYGNISLFLSFLILGISGLLLMIFIGIFLFPRYHITDIVPQNVEVNEQEKLKGDVATDSSNEIPPARLKSVIFSRNYLLQLVWFSCIFLRFQFFLTAQQQQMNYRFPEGEDVKNRLFSALNLFLFTGVFFAPLAGITTDTLILWMSKRGNRQPQEIVFIAFGILEGVCSLAALLLSCLIFVEGESVFYCLFFLEVVLRSMLFTLQNAFAVHFFPAPLFGHLYGIVNLISGFIVSLQFVFLQIFIVWGNIVMLAISVISLVQPINLIISSRRDFKQRPSDRQLEF